MIEANQLRIGNWYDDNGEYKQITANYISEAWEAPRTWMNPIPLTPEISVKFGFDLDDQKVWAKIHLPKSPNILCINVGGGIGHGTVWLKNSLLGVNLPSCLIAHQLQNLYFALTNEELIYKP